MFLCPAPAVCARMVWGLPQEPSSVRWLWRPVTMMNGHWKAITSDLFLLLPFVFPKNPDLVFQWIANHWEHPSGKSDNYTAVASAYFLCADHKVTLPQDTHSTLYFLLWRPKSFPFVSLLDIMLTLRSALLSICDPFNLHNVTYFCFIFTFYFEEL